MSNDAVLSECTVLSGTHLITVEHAELVVALSAAVSALDENGLHREANVARAVLHGMAKRAAH